MLWDCRVGVLTTGLTGLTGAPLSSCFEMIGSLRGENRDFPGIPVVRTPYLTARGPGSIPGWDPTGRVAKQTEQSSVRGFFTDCCRNPHVSIYSGDDPGTALDLSKDASGDCLHPLSLPGCHRDRDPPRVFRADRRSAARLPRCAERRGAAPLFSRPCLRAVSPFVLCRSMESLGLGVRPG